MERPRLRGPELAWSAKRINLRKPRNATRPVRICGTVLLALSACIDAGPSKLVERPPEPWPSRAIALGEELARIDGPDIFAVTDVVVAEDGRVILVQAGQLQLQYYDHRGRFRTAVGRPGQGPGEFRNIHSAGWAGDSLWVWDLAEHRYTVFSSDGDVERVARPPVTTPEAPFGMAIEHVYPGDTLLVWFENAPQGGDLVAFSRITAGGKHLQAIAQERVGEYGVTWTDGDRTGWVNVPFAPRLHYAATSAGERLVLARAFVEGRTDTSFVVTAVGERGDTAFVRRFAFKPEKIPDALMEQRLAMSDRMTPRVSARLREKGVPTYFPPLEWLDAGRDGTVWIRIRSTEELNTYRVLTTSGDPMGTLVLSSNQKVLEADSTSVWVNERDSLDVESIVHYRLRYPGREEGGFLTPTAGPTPRAP